MPVFQFVPNVKADPDWLSGWQYRKSHVIESASGAGTNYQVRIKVHYGSGTDSGEDVYLNSHCRTDFGDVRFTDDDGVTLLDYWIEEKGETVDSTNLSNLPDKALDAGGLAGPVNGKFYLFDGKNDSGYTSRTWEYDPENDSWNTSKTALGVSRSGFAAVYCPKDGKIYTFGGRDSDGNVLSRVDCYDPNNDSWSSKTAMPAARFGLRVIWVSEDEKFHVIGGKANGSDTKTHWTYDPSNDSWDTSPADLPSDAHARHGFQLSTKNGDLYVFCGYSTETSGAINDCWKWNHSTDSWTQLSNAPVACWGVGGYTANLVVGNKIYQIGGEGPSGTYHSTVRVYDIANDSWETLEGNLNTARDGHCNVYYNGYFYIVGGKSSSSNYLNTVEKIEIERTATFWVEIADDLSSTSATIYIYYGKSDATTTSNGKNTFPVFYDFETDESGEWIEDAGTWTWDTANGVLKSSGTGENKIRVKDVTVGTARAIRFRIKFDGDGNNYLGNLFAYQDGNNFYVHRGRIDGTTKHHLFNKKVAASWTTVFNENYDWSENVFYTLETQWISASKIKLLIDDSLRATVTSNLESWTSGDVGLRSYHESGDVGYYDLFLIRKCVDPEPSHGSWGTEETNVQEKSFTLTETIYTTATHVLTEEKRFAMTPAASATSMPNVGIEKWLLFQTSPATSVHFILAQEKQFTTTPTASATSTLAWGIEKLLQFQTSPAASSQFTLLKEGFYTATELVNTLASYILGKETTLTVKEYVKTETAQANAAYTMLLEKLFFQTATPAASALANMAKEATQVLHEFLETAHAQATMYKRLYTPTAEVNTALVLAAFAAAIAIIALSLTITKKE